MDTATPLIIPRFYEFVAYPDPKNYYAFEYGNAIFLGLDSTQLVDHVVDGEGKGTVYIVAGGAGAKPEWLHPKWAWHTAHSMAVPHFVYASVGPRSLGVAPCRRGRSRLRLADSDEVGRLVQQSREDLQRRFPLTAPAARRSEAGHSAIL